MTEPKTMRDNGDADLAADLLADDPEPSDGWIEYDAAGNRIPKTKAKPQSLTKAKQARSTFKKK